MFISNCLIKLTNYIIAQCYSNSDNYAYDFGSISKYKIHNSYSYSRNNMKILAIQKNYPKL